MGYHGRVNAINTFKIGPDQTTQYAFASLHTILSSSIAESVGIFCRAKSFSANSSGFWDQSNAIPLRAWSVFEFTNASPKFWIIIQSGGVPGASGGEGFAGSLGGTVDDVFNSSLDRGTIGISVAVREDGVSPWNGTTSGSVDSKGNPMWISGSSRMATFPLAGTPRGERPQGDLFHPTIQPGWNPFPVDNILLARTYHHYIFSEDSLTIVHGQYHGIFHTWYYFGRYNPVDASNPVPYCNVTFHRTTLEESNSVPQSFHAGESVKFGSNLIGGTFAGGGASVDGGGNSYSYSGGIVDPHNFRSTRVGYSRPDFSRSRRLMMNGSVSRNSIFNIPVYLDGYGSRGYVGDLENIKICHTLNNGATINNRSFAVFGQFGLSSKLAFRWGAPIPPGGWAAREGYVF